MEELIESLNCLTIALGTLAGVCCLILVTFLFCKFFTWLKDFEFQKDLQKQKLNNFTQADKNDLMFYVRQEMRIFKEELKKEGNKNESKN